MARVFGTSAEHLDAPEGKVGSLLTRMEWRKMKRVFTNARAVGIMGTKFGNACNELNAKTSLAV
ncbi:hypothetical protein PA598K_05486 [Paenibacillus sp. 598K]|nr:hypothetical protein PA598K_05486 [Paenibacillus sp. 598K]